MSLRDVAEVITAPSVDALNDRLSVDVAELLQDALSKRGCAHVAVSGGSFATRALPVIIAEANTRGVDFAAVHIWFADERFVEADSPHRSVLAVTEALRSAHGFTPSNLHAIPGCDTASSPDLAASEYERTLRESTMPHNDSGVPILDLALLGMGPDGHTASLFPGMLPGETALTAPITGSPKPPSDRVTMTFTMLNASRHSWIYATGSSKQDALTRAFDCDSAQDCPVSAVRAQETVRLYADLNAVPEAVRSAANIRR